MDRQKRLDALRAKMKAQDFSSGAGFWSPKQGLNTIRILPEVAEMQYFFQPVGRHYFPNGGGDCYCPSFTSEGALPCPICELVSDLYKDGQKELAKELRVRKSWWMNVIDRKDPKSGPQIFTPGQTVFGALVAMVNDPDYGDITDPETGLDIVIEREGEGLNTEYQVRSKRSSTPLAVTDDGEIDEDTINVWLDKAKDLAFVQLTNDPEEDKELTNGKAVYVYPYERIIEKFKLEAAEDEPLPSKDFKKIVDNDDDDEREYRSRPSSRRR